MSFPGFGNSLAVCKCTLGPGSVAGAARGLLGPATTEITTAWLDLGGLLVA